MPHSTGASVQPPPSSSRSDALPHAAEKLLTVYVRHGGDVHSVDAPADGTLGDLAALLPRSIVRPIAISFSGAPLPARQCLSETGITAEATLDARSVPSWHPAHSGQSGSYLSNFSTALRLRGDAAGALRAQNTADGPAFAATTTQCPSGVGWCSPWCRAAAYASEMSIGLSVGVPQRGRGGRYGDMLLCADLHSGSVEVHGALHTLSPHERVQPGEWYRVRTSAAGDLSFDVRGGAPVLPPRWLQDSFRRTLSQPTIPIYFIVGTRCLAECGQWEVEY